MKLDFVKLAGIGLVGVSGYFLFTRESPSESLEKRKENPQQVEGNPTPVLQAVAESGAIRTVRNIERSGAVEQAIFVTSPTISPVSKKLITVNGLRELESEGINNTFFTDESGAVVGLQSSTLQASFNKKSARLIDEAQQEGLTTRDELLTVVEGQANTNFKENQNFTPANFSEGDKKKVGRGLLSFIPFLS